MARKYKIFARVYRGAKYVGFITDGNAFIITTAGNFVAYKTQTIHEMFKRLSDDGYRIVVLQPKESVVYHA